MLKSWTFKSILPNQRFYVWLFLFILFFLQKCTAVWNISTNINSTIRRADVLDQAEEKSINQVEKACTYNLKVILRIEVMCSACPSTRISTVLHLENERFNLQYDAQTPDLCVYFSISEKHGVSNILNETTLIIRFR